MRTLTLIALLMVYPICAGAQCSAPSGNDRSDANSKQLARKWEQIADGAHSEGRLEEELQCRMQSSKLQWELIAQSPHALDKYELWNLLVLNDFSLAFLLEGKHRWDEAEKIYRHNQRQLAHLNVAGNDVKSDNELGLAHLLFSTGKTKEAQKICAHWKNRVRHNADFALEAVKTNIPRPPLYDSPEVETGRWDLACGQPQAGKDLLNLQMLAHPDMLTPYTALENYYMETGEFSKVLELKLLDQHLWDKSKN